MILPISDLALILANGPMGPFPEGVTPHTVTPGMTGWLVDLFILIIVSISSYTGSWGIAIISVAVLVKLSLFRLTVTQFTGMAWMQVLAPMQKALSEHFKADKETLNKKVMALYQELKINPLAGCLPLLIQMPILFAVIRALYNPSVFGDAKFLGIQLIYSALPKFALGMRQNGGHVDFSDPAIFNFTLGTNEINLYFPAFAIVLGYIASSLYYQFIMKKYQAKMPKVTIPGVAAEPPKQMMNQNAMTIIIVIFSMIIPAGAMIYFITQNVWSIFEYTFIMNSVIPQIKAKDLDSLYEKLIKPEPREPASKSKPPSNGEPSSQSDKPDEDSTTHDAKINGAAPPEALYPKPKRKRRRR
ncbi:MAG: YidC/Oxa1 family membrane protein insertase [bacterium]|jgi:YidC/Oxa1 family membrane protein insertase